MPWPSSVQSTLALAGAVVCGLYVWTQLLRSSSRTRRPAAACAGTIEPHEVSEVSSKVKKFEAVAELVQCSMSFRIVCEAVADDAVAGPGQKIVHFVRHGEGVHNVAQREWRSAASWDGMSEPYTLVTDPQGRYIDAELTPRGKQQAAALQARTALLHPQLLVVSPMRRATQTALIAFEHHVARGNLPVLANELCHETAGKHTCDKRLSKTALSASFPNVNYDAVRWRMIGNTSRAYQADTCIVGLAKLTVWLRISQSLHA